MKDKRQSKCYEITFLRFLALDKLLPKRPYLEIFEIDETECLESLIESMLLKEEEKEETKSEESKITLEYDPEWIAILKAVDKYTPMGSGKFNMSALLTKDNKNLVDEIQTALKELKSTEIVYNEDLVYTSYDKMHPQTKHFLETFNIQGKLFQPPS